MSTILNALKKAEQESIPHSEVQTPWPAPRSEKAGNGHRPHRWWLPVGAVVILSAFATLFWPDRQPPPTIPEAVVKTTLPSGTDHPQPHGAAPHMPQASPPALPVQPATKPSQTVISASAPRVQPPPLPQEKAHSQVTDMPFEPTAAPSMVSPSHPLERTADIDHAKTASTNDQKNFRNDSRIQLQALVWAPEANARFVLINNRLVKEGGLVDNIVVVRINPDDVLLSEGSDRWYEKFNLH